MTSAWRDGPLTDSEESSFLTVPAAATELASVRRWVRSVLASHDAPDDVVEDVELAVSELATNVVRHTDADTIRMRMQRNGGEWVLDVADAERVPEPADAELPPPDDPTGRGLYVVSSVMDRVEVVTVDDVTVIRCTRRDRS